MFRKRLSRYRTRNNVRRTIQRSAEQIETVKNDLEDSRADLERFAPNPSLDTFAKQMLEGSVRFMEQNLSELTSAHEQFIKQQERKSGLFPDGITLEQESAK